MNLLKALATIGSFTFLSRILGFIRDFVIARCFGAGAMTDAFFVAFKLPNLLRRLFAEGAFSQAFVPVLSETRSRRGDAATATLVNDVAKVLAFTLAIVVVLGIITAPILVFIAAPGYCVPAGGGDFWRYFDAMFECDRSPKFNLTVTLTRITFPYIFCMSMVAMAGGIQNTWSRFSIPALTPILLNVAMIAAALVANRWFHVPILALAWGVLLGGVLQLAMQIPALYRIGMLPRFSGSLKQAWQSPNVKRILRLMAPAVLGVSVAQISLIINTIFATFLATGSVSWLYYADRLMEFPTALLGVALGTVILPSLSKYHAAGNLREYSRLLDWGLRLALLLTLPAALAMSILAVPIITTLFMHGAFSVNDALRTEEALVAYSVGMSGLILVKILAPGFYAKQDIRTPVKIAFISLLATQLMNLAFISWLHHAGLALSIGLAACLNALLLFRGLRRRGLYHPEANWLEFIGKLLLALDAMGVVLWFATGDTNLWLKFSFIERTLRLSGLVVLGGVTYLAALYFLGFRWHDFRRQAA